MIPLKILIIEQIPPHRKERNIEGESRIFYLETLCHKILQLCQLIPPEHSAKLIRINHATFKSDRPGVCGPQMESLSGVKVA